MVVVIRTGRSIEKWCDRCNQKVRTVTPEQACLIFDTTLERMLASVDTDSIHFAGICEEELLICLNSVAREFFW